MALPAKNIDATEAMIAAYAQPSDSAKWASDARARALVTLRQNGAPLKRDEYWKFTDPARLLAPAPSVEIMDTGETPVFDSVDKLLIVFVDGIYCPDLSDELTMSGVEIETLAAAMSKDIHWASDIFGVLEANGQTPVSRPIAALNTALAVEGVVIRVSETAPKPIALRYLRKRGDGDVMVRNVIKLEKGTDLTLLENGAAAARFNSTLEVDIADGATFHHVRAQGRDHGRLAATHMFARLGKESRFKSFTLTVNGALTRNEAVIELTGDNAFATISGASAGDGAFHHDDTIFITHNAQNCESRQVFKKVLRNKATGVFQGKILVPAHAQKTDGYQIAQGLLLEDDCTFLAKPELEIYADDVVCSHGSTCGGVDETALFYLTSRGVSKAAAQDMLVLAFMDESIQEIEDEVLANIIRARLGGWMERRRG